MKKTAYKYYTLILIAGIVIFVSSCKIGSKYSRPELELPETIEEGRIDSLTIADLNWWEMYSDSVLQNLIGTALENNKDIKIASTRLRQYWASKKVASSALYPKAYADFHAEKEMENYGGNSKEKAPEYNLLGNVAWELDLWGNIRWGREASIADYFASVEAKRAVELSIVAQVAEEYFNLIALDDELRIIEQTIKSREEGAHIANLRFKGGLTSETSVQQAQVELANTKTLSPEIEKQIRIAENQLALLLGEFDNTITRGIGLSEQKMPEEIPIGLPSYLLERRPDILEAEQNLIASNAHVGVAVTNRFPRIALTAEFGRKSEDLGDLLKSPFWFFAGDIVGPLFEAGKLKHEQEISEAMYEGAIYAYQNTVLKAFHEVNSSLITVEKSKEITKAQRNLVRAAREYKRLGVVQYLNGVIGYLDLLDAQRSLLSAEIDLNNAKRDELTSLVQLYKSLGGGWTE